MFLSKKEHGHAMEPTTAPWAPWLEKFLQDKEGEISNYTMRKYRREIGRTLRMLCEAGLNCNPAEIGRKEIAYLIRTWTEQGLSKNYRIWRLNHLNLILRFYGNEIMKKMHLRLKPGERMNVRWLTEVEMERIWAAAEQLGPQYEIRIHLGLDLLLRKIEMYRLKVTDFRGYGNGHGLIHVLGKGKDGGKEALIPYHPDTEYYLKRYLEWREEQMMKAERRGEPVKDREAFLIWYRSGIGVAKEHYTTMDNRVAKISKLAGVKFSYHDLRRSGASFYYWIAGWDIVQVQHLLRHEKLETTIAYLGLKQAIIEQAMWAQTGRRGPHNPSAVQARNRLVSVMRKI